VQSPYIVDVFHKNTKEGIMSATPRTAVALMKLFLGSENTLRCDIFVNLAAHMKQR
jgi:hypothetical protein